jgi:hypothetical protein
MVSIKYLVSTYLDKVFAVFKSLTSKAAEIYVLRSSKYMRCLLPILSKALHAGFINNKARRLPLNKRLIGGTYVRAKHMTKLPISIKNVSIGLMIITKNEFLMTCGIFIS